MKRCAIASQLRFAKQSQTNSERFSPEEYHAPPDKLRFNLENLSGLDWMLVEE